MFISAPSQLSRRWLLLSRLTRHLRTPSHSPLYNRKNRSWHVASPCQSFRETFGSRVHSTRLRFPHRTVLFHRTAHNQHLLSARPESDRTLTDSPNLLFSLLLFLRPDLPLQFLLFQLKFSFQPSPQIVFRLSSALCISSIWILFGVGGVFIGRLGLNTSGVGDVCGLWVKARTRIRTTLFKGARIRRKIVRVRYLCLERR